MLAVMSNKQTDCYLTNSEQKNDDASDPATAAESSITLNTKANAKKSHCGSRHSKYKTILCEKYKSSPQDCEFCFVSFFHIIFFSLGLFCFLLHVQTRRIMLVCTRRVWFKTPKTLSYRGMSKLYYRQWPLPFWRKMLFSSSSTRKTNTWANSTTPSSPPSGFWKSSTIIQQGRQ